MPRDPNRTRRLESEIQRVVSELLRREVKDPRVGIVTLTAVRVSPDMGHAKIFYLPFDRTRDAASLQAGMDGAARFLRGQVGRTLKLRVAPELQFEVDEQFDQGMRLTEIIDAAVAHDQKQHGAGESAERDTDSGEEGEAGRDQRGTLPR